MFVNNVTTGGVNTAIIASGAAGTAAITFTVPTNTLSMSGEIQGTAPSYIPVCTAWLVNGGWW